MKALTLNVEERTGVVKDVADPEISSDEVLIQVKAIALNPVDELYTKHPLGITGRVMGSDFSGIVITVGSAVPASSNLQSGARVAGFLQGHSSANARPGAFAEYLAAPWDLVWHINEMTFEEAATVSLCALTAAQMLYYRLGFPAPFPWSSEEPSPMMTTPESIFINGATTSVGLYAAQLAKAASTPTVLYGSASTKHFAWLGSDPYRYDKLVDYRAVDWPQQILASTRGAGMDLALDCISEGSSVLRTAETLKPTSKLAVVRSRAGKAWDTPTDKLGIEPIYGAVWEGLGELVEYVGMTLDPDPKARAFTVAFYSWLSKGGNIVPNPVRLMPGGLERVVEDGFALLGDALMNDRYRGDKDAEWMRPVSGEKLVYRIS